MGAWAGPSGLWYLGNDLGSFPRVFGKRRKGAEGVSVVFGEDRGVCRKPERMIGRFVLGF